MRNFIKIAVSAVMLVALALAMVACGGDGTTTTAAGATTAAPGTTAAATTKANVTTTPAQTTVTPPPSSVPATGPYAFYKSDEVIEDFGGYTYVCNNGYPELQDGKIVASARLSMISSWEAVCPKGKISGKFTSAADNKSNDNGIIFCLQGGAIKDIIEAVVDDYNPYFFENDYAYYFLLCADGGGMGLAKVYWNTTAWSWLVPPKSDMEGYQYQHGDTFTLTADVKDDGVIDCYFNGQLMFSYTDTDPIVGGGGFGARLEEMGVVLHELTIEPAE